MTFVPGEMLDSDAVFVQSPQYAKAWAWLVAGVSCVAGDDPEGVRERAHIAAHLLWAGVDPDPDSTEWRQVHSAHHTSTYDPDGREIKRPGPRHLGSLRRGDGTFVDTWRFDDGCKLSWLTESRDRKRSYRRRHGAVRQHR